jgi:myosin heavy subunit
LAFFFYFRVMKRQLCLGVVLTGLCCLPSLFAADDSPAAIAARQEAEEERYKRMNAEIEDLKSALQSYQKNLQMMQQEIRRLSDEVSRANGNSKEAASKESLSNLQKAIEEVDKKRLADNELVKAEFARLIKGLSDKPSAPRSNSVPGTSSKPAPDPPKTGSEKGYEYAILSGDTLSAIVTKAVKQGVKVTQKQVIEANPNVNWNRLRIGQKIFIPAPAQP